jgi:TRAP-type mannitol/chloroaromatic compound transport system substrate-binding protein
MNTIKSRRKFVQYGLTLGAGLLFPRSLVRSLALGRKNRVLQYGGVRDLAHDPLLAEQIRNFESLIRSQSNSEIELRLSSRGFSYSAQELSDALKSGEIDFAFSSPSLSAFSHPAHAYFGALPSSLNADQKILWLSSDEAAELWTKLYENQGVQPLFFGAGSSAYGQVSRRPIQSLADFADLKVCSLDARQSWFRDLSATPVSYTDSKPMIWDLMRGKLDLTEALPHSANYKMGLHRNGFHYYANSWFRSSSAYEIQVARSRWSDLSSDEKSLFKKAATEVGTDLHRQIVLREDSFKNRIAAEGSEVMNFSPEIIRHFEGRALALRARLAEVDRTSAQIESVFSQFERKLKA